jgi:co-chaperonin GroES (HSP10)
MKHAFEPHQIKEIKALHDNILVSDMEFDARITSGGIIIPNDNGTGKGIRPRWARVYAVGPEQQDVVPGQWVMIEHGRWTRGLEVEIGGEEFTLRRVDPACIIFVSDEEPNQDDTLSTAVYAERKER